MAKRKKAHTTRRRTHTRRRKVSGVGSIDVTSLALTVAGGVAARILSNKLASSTGTMGKIAPYAPVILGVILPMVIKNNPMVNGLSVGLVAGGGVTALGPTGLKIISGFENSIAGIGYPMAPQIPYRRVAGLVSGPAQSQGLTRGTRSNFSGSRKSQINTIAGVGNFDGSGSGSGN